MCRDTGADTIMTVRTFLNMRLRSRFFQLTGFAAFAAALVSLVPADASAATGTWLGTTSGIWSDATNWSINPAPGTADTALFNGAGNGNIVIDVGTNGPITINTVLFDTSSAAAYTIGSGGAGSQTLTLSDAGAITVNSTVTNNQLFNSNLSLGSTAGASTFTFTNNSAASTLTIAGAISATSPAAGTNKALSIAGVGNVSITGNINIGTGDATNDGIIITDTTTGTLRLSGNDHIATLNLNGFLAATGQTSTVDLAGGTLTINGLTSGAGGILSTRGATINDSSGTGSITLLPAAGAAATNGADVGTANGTTLVINAKLTGASGNAVEFFNTGTNFGTGVVVLNGANSYAGPTIISGGVVSVSKFNTDGTGNLGTNGTINFGSFNANTSTGILRYTGTGETASQTINLQGTTVGGIIDQSGTGTLTFNGGVTSSVAAGNNQTKTLTLMGSTSGIGVLGGTIVDSSNGTTSIQKIGTGTWQITGTPSYGGATTINGGILDITSTAVMPVASGAIVLGGGTLKYESTSAAAFNGATLNLGESTIDISAGQIALGGTGRAVGSSINIINPNPSLFAISTTRNNFATGFWAGWATINGTDWLVGPDVGQGSTPLSTLTNYVSDTWAAGNNTTVTLGSNTISDGSSTNSLRFNALGANTVTLSGTASISSGGILVTSAVGANLSRITGGVLKGAIINNATSNTDITINQYNSAGALTIDSVIPDALTPTSILKVGPGALNLTGANTYSSSIDISEGTVSISNMQPAGARSGVINVGDTTGKIGVLNISGASTFLSRANLAVGGTTTNVTESGFGAVNQSGGNVQIVPLGTGGTGTAGTGVFQVGAGANSYGYYQLSGGTLTTTEIGVGGGNNTLNTVPVNNYGVMDVNGGTLIDTVFLTVARGNGSGVMNVNNGGTVVLNNNNVTTGLGNFNMLFGGSNLGTATNIGVMNISNGSLLGPNQTGYSFGITAATVPGSLGAINLGSGGLFQAYQVNGGNASTYGLLNFNGGALRFAGTPTLNTTNATFLTGTNTRVFIYSNGATIDDNGGSVTVAASLLAPNGNGVVRNANPISNGGSGYIGPPVVLVSGGGGYGATASAVVVNGQVTDIVITNPGVGYTSAPTFTLQGGGGSGATIDATKFGLTANLQTGGLTKIGAGTVTLSGAVDVSAVGANTYTGDTTIGQGTLALNFSTATTLTTNIINSGSRLVLSGGGLTLTGKASTTNSQLFNTTTLNAGGNQITMSPNATANPLLLNLAGITRNAGSTLNVTLSGASSGTNGVVTSTGNNASNILGGYATVGGAAGAGDWATISGTNIIALPAGSYTNFTGAGVTDTLNYSTTAATTTLSGAVSTNSLKIASTASSLNLAGNSLTFNGASGGLLFAGTAPFTISDSVGSNNLSAGSGNELIIQDWAAAANTLTISTPIIGNNAGSLTKAGTGILILTAANLYTGNTTIGAGTLQLGTSAAVGSVAGNIVDRANLSVVTSATAQSINNLISGTGGTLSITGSGAGALTVGGANTFTGGTTLNITAGKLVMGANSVIGPGPLGSVTSGPLGTGLFTLTAGTLDLNGKTVGLNGFTAAAGTIENDGAGQATLVINENGASTNLNAAAAGSARTITATIRDNGGSGGTVALTKQGFGMTVLVGTDTYTGPTTISYGTLTLGNGVAAGNGSIANSSGISIATAATLAINNNDAQTLSNTITGAGSVNKLGAGVLTFNGSANTFSGGTTLSAGTLQIGNANALGTGPLIINGGTLDNTASVASLNNSTLETWNASFTYAGVNPLNLGTGIISLGATPTVTTTAASVITASPSLTVPGVINGAFGLTKAGLGTMNLAGSAVYTGTTTVSNGNLNVTSTGTINPLQLTASGRVTVGDTANQVGVLNVDAGTVYASNNGNALDIGTVAGASGVVNVKNSGTVTILNNGTQNLRLGAGGYGALNVSSGTVSIPSGSLVVGNANAAAGVGIVNISGGLIDVYSQLAATQSNFSITVGNNGAASFGVLNVTGGILRNATNPGIAQNNGVGLYLGEVGTGIMNVSGAGLVSVGGPSGTSAGLFLAINGTTSAGVVNLGAVGSTSVTDYTNGTILVSLVHTNAGAGNAVFNFHGGTLQTTRTAANFMTGLTRAYIYGEGGVIDTNGSDITVGQALLAPSGQGIAVNTSNTSIPLATGGTGYVSPPVVKITGGSGFGATAVATISAAGAVTGVTLTNPGSGYATTDTITVTLTGGSGTASAGTAATLANGGSLTVANTPGLFAANVSTGGLTKIGGGNLTLTGVATGASGIQGFGGPVNINAGTLTVGAAAVVGAVSSNSALGVISAGRTITVGTSTSPATLNGTAADWFAIDTAATAATVDPALPSIVVNSGSTLTTAQYTAIGNLTLNGGVNGAATLTNNSAAQETDLAKPAREAFAFRGSVTVGGTVPSIITSTSSSATQYGYHLGTNTTFNVADLTGGDPQTASLTVSAALRDQSGDFGSVYYPSAMVPGGLTKQGAGTMLLTGNNTYTGNTTISGGALVVNPTSTSSSLNSAITNNSHLVSLVDSGKTYTFSKAIGGSGDFVQAGLGTTVLTGASNGYSGPTTVNAGKLALGGSLTGTSGVTIASAATLGTKDGLAGSISIAGGITTNGGAIDMQNHSTNAITMGGTLNVASSAAFTFDIDSANAADKLATSGLFSVGGGQVVTLNINNLGAGAGTYDLIQYGTKSGVTLNSSVVLGSFVPLPGSYTFSLNDTGSVIQLQIAGIAAPGEAWFTNRVDTNWNTLTGSNPPATNWSTTADGLSDPHALVNSGTIVHFAATNASSLSTTLGADVTIKQLFFDSGTGSVTISGNNQLNIGSGGITINNNGSPNTISATTLGLGAPQVWNNASNSDFTVQSVLADRFGAQQLTINSTGTGAIKLSGANTYAGGTVLAGGTLLADNASALGAGPVTVNGGKLQLTQPVTLGATNGSMTVAGGTVDLNGNTLTVNGLLSVTSGTVELHDQTLTVQSATGGFLGNGGVIQNNLGSTVANLSIVQNNTNTFSGTIRDNAGSGTGTVALSLNGPGIQILLGTQPFTGSTSINSGTLQLGDGTTTPNASVGGAIGINGALVISNPNDQTMANAISGTGSLRKLSNNKLTLTGANNGWGVTSVSAGTLDLAGNTITATTGRMSVADVAGSAKLVLEAGAPGASLNALSTNAPSISAGSFSGANGTIIMNSGSSISTGSELWLGTTTGAYGSLTMNGNSSLTVVSWFSLQRGAGTGILNVKDTASVTVTTNNLSIGSLPTGTNQTVAVATLTGGTVTTSATAANQGNVYVGENVPGILNVAGTAVLNPKGANGVSLALNTPGAGLTNPGILNLGAVANGDGLGAVGGGGRIVAPIIRQGTGTSGTFNFHGGTLQPTGNGNFMGGITNAFVYGEGATFDTTNPANPTDGVGLNITVTQSLLTPSGQGVTSITGLGGSGYLDTPLVTLSAPASGTQATAIARIDYSSGALLGITITNPGTGYTTAPAVTLTGGGGTPSGTATVTLGSNSSGGVTKIGPGILTLSGANTYTGNTTIGNGVTLFANQLGQGGIPGGSGALGGTSRLVFNGGLLRLDTGDFSRSVGTGVSNVSWAGDGGFVAANANRTVNLGGVAAGVTWASGGFVPGGNQLMFAGDATGRSITFANPIDFNGAQRTIAVGTNNVSDPVISVTLSGSLTGASGGLTKTGLGSLIVAGSSNTYTGPTSVVQGTLQLNKALAATSGLTLGDQANQGQPGGTLIVTSAAGNMTWGAGGITSYGGTINMQNGVINTLSVSGPFTTNSTTSLNFDIGPSLTADRINAGALNFTGSSPTINIVGLAFPATGTYTLIHGTSFSGNVAQGSVPSIPGLTLTLSTTSTDVQLTVSPANANDPPVAYWRNGAGTGLWNNAANWVDAGTGGNTLANIPGYGTQVHFANSAATGLTTNTLGSDMNIQSLSFDATTGPVTIGGTNKLSITNGITVNNNNANSITTSLIGIAYTQTWNNAGSGTLTVSSSLIDDNGPQQLTINNTGSGSIVLSGDNSAFTGGVVVAGGTLQVRNPNGLGANGTPVPTVNGGVLDLHGTSLTLAGLQGSGGIVNTGIAGTTTLTVNETGTHTYYGSLQNGAGALALVKQGAGTMILAGNSTFNGAAGTTTISAGTLQLGDGTTAAGSLASNIANSAALVVNDPAGTTSTLPGVISGVGTLTKLGPGNLVLSGQNTYPPAGTTTANAGSTTVNGGTLTVSATGAINTANTAGGAASVGRVSLGTINAKSQLIINGQVHAVGGNASIIDGLATGSASTIIVNNLGVLTCTNDFLLGSGNVNAANSGGYGALTVNSGGTVTITNGTLAMGRAFLGDGNFGGNQAAAGAGILNINGGGTVTTQTISGGSFATQAGGFALFNIGGSLTATNLAVGDGAYSGIMNLFGTGSVTATGNFTTANNAAMFGITNLGAVTNGDGLGAAGGGGTLTINNITKGAGTGIFNFHGGTLKPRATSATFMTGLTSANVYSEGANIDTATFNATVAQALLAPAGQGVTTISGLSGTGYIDIPLVTLSAPPAGGTLATARAVVDGTGALTGIIVTNPGTGYTSAPTVVLSGGGGTPSGTATVNLGSNTSGGLTKLGLGTLTLSAAANANTYTGATTVTAGTLALGVANEITATTQLKLNGGTFATGGLGQAMPSATLQLSANSTIDFGAGASILRLADSHSVNPAWTNATLLTVNNWTPTAPANPSVGNGTDQLLVGASDLSGLTPTQLTQIHFTGYLSSQLVANGVNGEVVPKALAVRGDVDQDTHVNIADVSAMMGALSDVSKYQAGTSIYRNNTITNWTNSDLLEIANLNNDTVVNNLDAQALIVYLANNPTGLPAPGGGSLSAVPEPGSVVLLAIGGLAVAASSLRNARRRRNGSDI
jgi:fibronectin-binding autotransporter adhesin